MHRSENDISKKKLRDYKYMKLQSGLKNMF